MSAFSQAWHLLKALPEQRGYMGTLPPAILQMLERRRQEAGEEGLGDVRHFDVAGTNEGASTGGEGQMRTTSRPVEMGEGRGERIPKTNLRVHRDISPLQEMQETMVSHTPRVNVGDFAGGGGTSMANVRGYDTMPEESFFTPREARMAREGTEQAVGRQLTGGQRGGRTNIRGGSGAGINLPLRGVDDEGKRLRHGGRRRATTLQNVEGVGMGAQLGGASSQFVDEPEDKAPTQQERIASILSGMPGLTDIQMGAEPPKEEKPTKEMPLRTMSNRYRENLERVRRGEDVNTNVPLDEETMQMFGSPGSPESQAIRERLMQFARQQGSADGSTAQNAIDRAA